MNKKQKSTFKASMVAKRQSLWDWIKTGEDRGSDAKQHNYSEVKGYLTDAKLNTSPADVAEAATIVGEVLGRIVEVEQPPADGGAARKLVAVNRDSSTVTEKIDGVDVRIDIDQLKHQHKNAPIGTRIKGGGNRFKATCNAAWHRQNTMVHMAKWAKGLKDMGPGAKRYHGQAEAVDTIHYEGFCLMASGQKYVLFHCYPSDDSPHLWTK